LFRQETKTRIGLGGGTKKIVAFLGAIKYRFYASIGVETMIEIMLDTSNIEDISRYVDLFPVSGITTNPSILKHEGKIDFFPHLKKIREIIGTERSLHIQITMDDFQGFVKEAETIIRKIDDRVFIKIPSTEEGLKVMGYLRSRGLRIVA
jgi:transaldolase